MNLGFSARFGGLALAAFASAPAVFGQAVHVIGPAGGPGVEFSNVQAAIDAAADGDILLFRDGIYSFANLGAKSLTLVADVGAAPKVTAPIRSEGAVGRILLKGIKVWGDPAVIVSSPLAGISIEDSDLRWDPSAGFTLGPRVVVTSAAFVSVARTLMSGATSSSGAALTVQGTPAVTIYGGSFTGGSGSGGIGTPAGGPGIRLDGGFTFASGATFKGGQGGTVPGVGGGAGGAGALLLGGAALLSLDSTFAGGSGGQAFGGGFPGPAGLPVQLLAGSTWTTLPQEARSFSASTVVREG